MANKERSGKKKHAPKPRKLCVYCGTQLATTRDHVIARCLFPDALPLNMVTVPVCHACNEAKSRDDDYLRDMLVMDLNSGEHSGARKLLLGEVLRSASSNRSIVARSAKASWKMEPLLTKGGIYLGHHPTFLIDGERVTRTFTYIVRGLYYRILQQRIPDNYSFEVRRLNPWDVEAVWEGIKKLNPNGPYGLGNTFVCAFLRGLEDPFVTYWLLGFYESVFVTVSTEPVNQHEDDDLTAESTAIET